MSRTLAFVASVAAVLLSSPANSGTLIDDIRKGDLFDIERAIAAGADVNAGIQTTPLSEAVKRGRYDVSELLLAHGANVNMPTLYSGEPLMIAAWQGRPDLMLLLLRHGASAESMFDGVSALHVATTIGCMECIRALVEFKADVNVVTRGCEARTPLHIARVFRREDISAFLMAHGAVDHSERPDIQ